MKIRRRFGKVYKCINFPTSCKITKTRKHIPNNENLDFLFPPTFWHGFALRKRTIIAYSPMHFGMFANPRYSDHFLKVPSALSDYLVRFWFLLDFTAVPKRYQNLFDFHLEVQKLVWESWGRARWLPMAVRVQFFQVFGSIVVLSSENKNLMFWPTASMHSLAPHIHDKKN